MLSKLMGILPCATTLCGRRLASSTTDPSRVLEAIELEILTTRNAIDVCDETCEKLGAEYKRPTTTPARKKAIEAELQQTFKFKELKTKRLTYLVNQSNTLDMTSESLSMASINKDTLLAMRDATRESTRVMGQLGSHDHILRIREDLDEAHTQMNEITEAISAPVTVTSKKEDELIMSQVNAFLHNPPTATTDPPSLFYAPAVYSTPPMSSTTPSSSATPYSSSSSVPSSSQHAPPQKLHNL